VQNGCRWNFEEIGVRFGLIPPSDAGILNALRIAHSTVLNFQVCFTLPNHCIVNVDSVGDDAVIGFADAAMQWRNDMTGREIPAAVVVVFRSCPVEDSFAINIKQLVALKEAQAGGALHRHRCTDEMTP